MNKVTSYRALYALMSQTLDDRQATNINWFELESMHYDELESLWEPSAQFLWVIRGDKSLLSLVGQAPNEYDDMIALLAEYDDCGIFHLTNTQGVAPLTKEAFATLLGNTMHVSSYWMTQFELIKNGKTIAYLNPAQRTASTHPAYAPLALKTAQGFNLTLNDVQAAIQRCGYLKTRGDWNKPLVPHIESVDGVPVNVALEALRENDNPSEHIMQRMRPRP